MKYLIIILTLLFSINSYAATDKDCETFSELAGLFMELQQKGVPASKTLKIAGDDKLLRAIVVSAYKRPKYSKNKYTIKLRRKQVRDFKDDAFLDCLRTGEY